VVKQRRAQGLGVEPHPRADLRDADRMDDEVLSRLAALIGVVGAGVHECLLHPIALNRDRRLGGMLLDDREQVAEQPPLGGRELRAVYRTMLLGVLDPVNGWSRRDQGRALPRARTTIGTMKGRSISV